jgi:hypothetical protein
MAEGLTPLLLPHECGGEVARPPGPAFDRPEDRLHRDGEEEETGIQILLAMR